MLGFALFVHIWGFHWRLAVAASRETGVPPVTVILAVVQFYDLHPAPGVIHPARLVVVGIGAGLHGFQDILGIRIKRNRFIVVHPDDLTEITGVREILPPR